MGLRTNVGQVGGSTARRWTTSPAAMASVVPSSVVTSRRPLVDPGGGAEQVAVGAFDADRPADGAEPGPVRDRGRLEIGEAGLVAGEEGVEQLVAGGRAATLEVAGRRDAHQLVGDLGPVDVDPDPDDHGVARRLGQDPGELAVADEQVVRPLQRSRRPRWSPTPPRPSRPRRPSTTWWRSLGRESRAGAAPTRAATRRAVRSRSGPGGPDPPVWWSATTTSPSGAPARAASSSVRGWSSRVSASQRTSPKRPGTGCGLASGIGHGP